MSPETLAAQGLGEADPVSGGLAPVINLSTNYEQQPDGSYREGRVYTRADNPTSEHAEQLLAALEGGALEGGCACALFGSGMAAATAVFQSLLPGDHVLVSRVLYWGVRKWLAEFAAHLGPGRRVHRHRRPGRGGRGHPARPHPAALGGDPGQPDVGDHRPRRRLPSSRTRPAPGSRWTTRWPRRC